MSNRPRLRLKVPTDKAFEVAKKCHKAVTKFEEKEIAPGLEVVEMWSVWNLWDLPVHFIVKWGHRYFMNEDKFCVCEGSIYDSGIYPDFGEEDVVKFVEVFPEEDPSSQYRWGFHG